MAILLLFAYSTSSHCAELKVGIYNNPPKIFLDESEKPAGIFPDILEYIAKNEGCNLLQNCKTTQRDYNCKKFCRQRHWV